MGLDAVTVGTTNVAFIDLSLETFQAPLAHVGDGVLFSTFRCSVVEFENPNIRFATIQARMLGEIARNEKTIADSSAVCSCGDTRGIAVEPS